MATPGWGAPMFEKVKKGMPIVKLPVLDGSTSISKKTGELNAGFDDSVLFIRTQSGKDNPPLVRFASEGVPATNADVYSGCHGKAVVNAFSWAHPTGGNGVSFGIRYFQRLGGAIRSAARLRRSMRPITLSRSTTTRKRRLQKRRGRAQVQARCFRNTPFAGLRKASRIGS